MFTYLFNACLPCIRRDDFLIIEGEQSMVYRIFSILDLHHKLKEKLNQQRSSYPLPYAINDTCNGKADSRPQESLGFTNTQREANKNKNKEEAIFDSIQITMKEKKTYLRRCHPQYMLCSHSSIKLSSPLSYINKTKIT